MVWVAVPDIYGWIVLLLCELLRDVVLQKCCCGEYIIDQNIRIPVRALGRRMVLLVRSFSVIFLLILVVQFVSSDFHAVIHRSLSFLMYVSTTGSVRKFVREMFSGVCSFPSL